MENMNLFGESKEAMQARRTLMEWSNAKRELKANNNTKKETPAFGIDLGTTNSAIAVVSGGNIPHVISLDKGRKTIPSCVMWKDGVFTAGMDVFNQRYLPNVSYSVKRFMQDPDAIITLNDNGKTINLTPVQISAEILRALIKETGMIYGEIKDVVITVPAHFNQQGLKATREAAESIGLNVLSILREPTAASLCYDLGEGDNTEAIVYDLGGGTFDVSVVRITSNDVDDDVLDIYDLEREDSTYSNKIVSVIANDGDMKLGGDDVDQEMWNIVESKLAEMGYNVDLIIKEDRERMILELEKLKRDEDLCNTMIEFHVFARLTEGDPISTNIMLYGADFGKAFLPTYKKTKVILDRVITESKTKSKKIVLVGGSTKNPFLTKFLKEDYPDFEINNALNPDESVANGAAIKAKADKFGDADVKVFDILPLGIGILESDNNVTYLINKNTQVPKVVERQFTTVADNQTEVKISLYQGISRYPQECVDLGSIIIDEIAPRPAGEPDLAVKLTVNADGYLTCVASVDGKEKAIELSLSAHSNKEIKLLSREEKLVLKWRAKANELGGVKGRILNGMIDNYGNGVSKQEIMDYIRGIRGEFKTTVDTSSEKCVIVDESK